MVEFEDGLWIVNHLKARNDLQRVCTIPRVQPEAVHTLNSNLPRSAWLPYVRQVRFLAAAVLGLTQPREIGSFVLNPEVRQYP